ncbi:unnamed protein product [Rotaria sp. Silwood2]|nr:unnamed protein product [Rotaria sp. Silwood2]CAF2916517.1 unnamed protein product [Rotaria sp. Silwood2]CAF4389945.1 unnamed protein product [Rotaria sp. Silwood2]CAF4490570.1 unnamed protein product [Rotaria sp. Silwood2]
MASDSIIGRLQPAQVIELSKAFMEFDINGNGFITFDEMKESLRRANMPRPDAEIQQVMSKIDFNRDGMASYDEFMRFMANISNTSQKPNPPWQ